ncbi:MAG: PDZ domain-containing protein [Bacteroidales bacterium]
MRGKNVFSFTLLLIVGVLLFSNCRQGSKKDVEGAKLSIPNQVFNFNYLNDNILINGIIDSVEGNFVLDIGTDNLCLDGIFISLNDFPKLNLKRYNIGGIGTTYPLINLIEDTLVFNYNNYKMSFSNIPFVALKTIMGDNVDGILGYSFVKDKVLEINYDKEYIRMYSSIDSMFIKKDDIAIGGWKKIHMIKEKKNFSIPLEIAINNYLSIKGNFLLKLGLSTGVSIFSSTAYNYNLNNYIENKIYYYSKSHQFGAKFSTFKFYSRSVQIADYKLNDFMSEYESGNKNGVKNDNYLGEVGNGLFEHFDLCVDFINNDLYLRPNKNFNTKEKSIKLGFTYLDRTNTFGSWVVSTIIHTSKAEKAGLHLSDRIVKVNGISIKDIGIHEQQTYFDDLDSLTLELNRGNQLIQIGFRLTPILKNIIGEK